MADKLSDSIDWNATTFDPSVKTRLKRELDKVGDLTDARAEDIRRVVSRVGERAPGKYDEHAEAEGTVHAPGELHKSYHASTVILAKDCMAILEKHYPGWDWAIQVNETGQMFNLFNHHCHDKYAYKIRIRDLMNDPSRRVVLMGAGELLERFGLQAKGLSAEQAATIAAAPRDGAGNLIPDISDLPDKKAAHQAELARMQARGDLHIVEMPNGEKFARIKT